MLRWATIPERDILRRFYSGIYIFKIIYCLLFQCLWLIKCFPRDAPRGKPWKDSPPITRHFFLNALRSFLLPDRSITRQWSFAGQRSVIHRKPEGWIALGQPINLYAAEDAKSFIIKLVNGADYLPVFASVAAEAEPTAKVGGYVSPASAETAYFAGARNISNLGALPTVATCEERHPAEKKSRGTKLFQPHTER